ncbi:MAG TPA: shikimate kinase [Bacteroidetes bacterium]|nr:shikimate kinase [Bacteroidota bacterium]
MPNSIQIKKVVFIGYRGVGKTTVSKDLADKLKWPYVSSDEKIEEKCGMTIREFVASSGWQEFRKLEKSVIEELSNLNHVVIDCGGGVVEDAQNMERLSKNALIVWVDSDMEDIYKRLSKAMDRPRLENPDLKKDVDITYQKRLPLYRKYSHIYLNTSQLTIDECSRVILDALKNMS